MVIMDVLNFLRDFFTQSLVPRKRRAPEEFDAPVNTKLRKMSSPEECINLLDDMVTGPTYNRKRSSNIPSNERHRASTAKPDVINLDEEDDDVILTESREFLRDNSYGRYNKFTSTPNYISQRPKSKDEDVQFLSVIQPSPENRLHVKNRRSNISATSPTCTSLFMHNGSSQKYSSPNNGAIPKFSQNGFGSHEKKTSTPNMRQRMMGNDTTSPTFRLHEKKIYKQLLLNAAPTFHDSYLDPTFSDYGTPMGSLFDGFTSSKNISNHNRSANRSKNMEFVDLTDTHPTNRSRNRLSTRDTIKKVIDNFQNDLIVVNSDSSDVEILPTPPSPKRDYEIKRINSLKTFVDPAEPCHDDWVNNLLRKHKEDCDRRERAIQEQKNQRIKLHEINSELISRRLEEDVRRCLKIKDTLLPVQLPEEEPALPTLSDEQQAMVARALEKYADDGEVLARKFNLNITRRDMKTLSGLNWLNDEVINFYMNLIIERGKNPSWPSAYSMNTFFYPKYLKDGFSSVRRWTKKIDIFAHDVICVPIHLRMHWCMAVIDLRTRKITYYDSMGSPNRLCLESLYKYLQEEHLDKKKCVMDTTGWELINAKDIPQQMNGSDCGMFSCTFAEFLSRDAKITFSQEDMPYLRRKMVVEIIEGRLLIS